MLTTETLIWAIRDLVLNGDSFFKHHDQTTDIFLGHHLHCVIEGLRLLFARLRRDGGSLSFNDLDQLYNKISWWQSFHERQATDSRRDEQRKLINDKNEFLIVHARNLISSIKSDQTVISNLKTRGVALARGVAYAVGLIL